MPGSTCVAQLQGLSAGPHVMNRVGRRERAVLVAKIEGSTAAAEVKADEAIRKPSVAGRSLVIP
jgi:hypothetical protein